MARYKGPKCRLCRREGTKLYLKGTKCESEKCTINKRNYAPGQHGTSRRRLSDFGIQLREKQKAKRIYGLLEGQFRNYVEYALKSKGVSGEVLLQQLERRLDNVVYRSGFAVSRPQARQLVRSGYFKVNNEIQTVPSTQIGIGDTVTPVKFEKLQLREGFVLPEWLDVNVKQREVKLSRYPVLDELNEAVNVQLIIEYYSR